MYIFKAIDQEVISNITDPGTPLDNFVTGVDSRGSFDIIWSCIMTILLCCWVSTYPNVPAPDDTWWHATVDKFNMACIGMLGPDFLFAIAMGQLSSAIRSVRAFERDSYLIFGSQWTLTHGFYADMGGFYLSSPDYPFGFPINAEQFHYLLKHRYIDFPDMDLVGIDEKNQSDTFSRLLAMVSAAWFFIKEFDHLWQGNPITVLELTALTFAFVMISTSICWYYKPCISKPYYIQTRKNITVKQIRRRAKRLSHAFYRDKWYRTPLEFVGNRKFSVYNHWAYYVRLSQRLHVPIFSRPVLSRPWDRWPSDTFFAPEPVVLPLGFVVLVGFSASFLVGWNFFFPTKLEQTLWRSASVYNAFFACFAGLYYLIEAIRFHYSVEKEIAASEEASNPDAEPVKVNLGTLVRAMTGTSKRPAKPVDNNNKNNNTVPPVPSIRSKEISKVEGERKVEGGDDNPALDLDLDDDLDLNLDLDLDDDDDDDNDDDKDGDFRKSTHAAYKRDTVVKIGKADTDKDPDNNKNNNDTNSPPRSLERSGSVLSQAPTLTGDATPSPARTLPHTDTTSIIDSDIESLSSEREPRPRLLRRITHLLRSLTPYNDPDMRVALSVLIPVSFVCLFYMVARGTFYVLDFHSLRSQPRGVYFDDFFFSIWGADDK